MHGRLPHFVVTLNFLVSKDSSSEQQLIPSFISRFLNLFGVIIFTARWVSLHGRLSYLVVSHFNNLISLFTNVPLSQKQNFYNLITSFLTQLAWAALSGVGFILVINSLIPDSVCMGGFFRSGFHSCHQQFNS